MLSGEMRRSKQNPPPATDFKSGQALPPPSATVAKTL
jgi:hypothetical protein